VWAIAGDIYYVYEQSRPLEIDPADLAAAQEKLAALPLETIPSPEPLPSGSRMPLSKNPLFVGREADLRWLAQTLKGGQTAAIGQIAAATGLGGIGKTQLASEFVYRYGQFFGGGVFWLNFADAAAVPTEIALCGGIGGMALQPQFEQLAIEDQLRAVASAWQSPLPRLLIFDNCEDEALLARWRPPAGGCRVLVTSRRGTWNLALGVQAWSLGVLRRDESVALLRKFRPNLATAVAEAIAQELGDLPLALHLAGSFLRRYQHAVSPERYLTQLCDQALLNHPSLQGRGEEYSPTDHELHVGRTFALSYDRLDPADPTDQVALALLSGAVCFAGGQPIPRGLLLATLDLPEDELEAALRVEDGLGRLVALGLLEEEDTGALVLHRLLVAFVQQVLPVAEAQVAVEETLLAEANRLNNAGYPAPLLVWQPHLRAVTELAQARTDERGAGLCATLGYHLHMIGAYAEARPDVVLMDLLMPVMDGLTAIRALRAEYPAARVIALTSYLEESIVTAALAAGACRCLGKHVSIDELADTIRAAAAI